MNIELWKKRKKDLKLTHDALALKSGISRRTIAGIFSGDPKYSSPTINTVQAIEQALGLNAPTWSENDRAQGVTDTITRKLTPEDDDIISIYHEIKQKKGANAQALAKKILEQIRDS